MGPFLARMFGMPFDAAIAFVATCSLALGLGCGTLEPIHRPPTPAEIDRVNAAGGPLVVELLSTDRPTRTIDHVVSADAAKIVVDAPRYQLYPRKATTLNDIPLDDVSAFSALRPGRGAAIGAAVGAGASTAFIASLGFGFDAGFDARFAQVIFEAALVSGAAGALIGWVFGSPHFFPLDLGPTRDYPPVDPGPPLPPTPPLPRPRIPSGMRSASVVAPSAEVRSAPFKVAPVVVVLAQGQHLQVDPTPNAGWRVAFLSDGRVGYIQDAKVQVGEP